MNVDYELYRIFCIVADNGNITRAANQLNISQPAISKSIKILEDKLGGQLFIRTKRGVNLTSEGKELYYYIKQAIEYVNNAENRFSQLINLDTGCIKIGISTTLTKEFLLPYLKEFHSKYPKIEIQITTNVASELFVKLRNGLIDLIILNMDDRNYGSDIDLIKCHKIQDCFVVNNSFKQLINKEMSLNELNNYPLILQTKGSNARDFIDQIARNNNVSLKPNIELASYTLVVEFAKNGFGIGYATKNYINKDLETGILFEINLKEKIPNRYIGIATSKNHLPNFSTKKLVEIITKK